MNPETEIPAFLEKPIVPPTYKEIDQAINLIKDKLAVKAINRFVNAPIKEGYLKSLDILKHKQTDFKAAKVGDLKTVQGRAIAVLAIDFLIGECTEKILCNVPIKER